jgi:hypothetical protein
MYFTDQSSRDTEIINEVLERDTHVFDSPNSPRDSEIINEFRSQETHGFNSPRDSEISNEVL